MRMTEERSSITAQLVFPILLKPILLKVRPYFSSCFLILIPVHLCDPMIVMIVLQIERKQPQVAHTLFTAISKVR